MRLAKLYQRGQTHRVVSRPGFRAGRAGQRKRSWSKRVSGSVGFGSLVGLYGTAGREAACDY